MSMSIWTPWIVLAIWTSLDVIWCALRRKAAEDVITTAIDTGAFVVTITAIAVVSEWIK